MSLFSPTISNLLVSPFTRKFLTEDFFDDFTEPSREQEVFSTHHQVLTIHSYRQVYDRKPAPYIRTGRLLSEGTEENKIVTPSRL